MQASMPLLTDYDERSPLGTDGKLKNYFPNNDGEFYLSKKFRKRMTNGEHVLTSVENIWFGGGGEFFKISWAVSHGPISLDCGQSVARRAGGKRLTTDGCHRRRNRRVKRASSPH